MKISFLSDLHLEFDEQVIFPSLPTEGVIILAGDIHQGIGGMQWARKNFDYQDIIYVSGNHEYYGFELESCESALIEAADELGIHYLNNRKVEINGVEFIGTTLWTDFRLFNNSNEALYDCRKLDDYRLIRSGRQNGRKLSPLDTMLLHSEARAFLEASITAPHENRVIITHHAPSLRSVSERFKTHRLSPAYASHLDELVAKSKAKFWFHGHTHTPTDYSIADTRVLSNPAGFPGERIRDTMTWKTVKI